MLEEEPLGLVKPIVEELMDDVDQNKQRAASELTAGLIGGSKHWPVDAQERLWAWLTPKLTKVLTSSVKTDTMLVWTSFLEASHLRPLWTTATILTLRCSISSSRVTRGASNHWWTT